MTETMTRDEAEKAARQELIRAGDFLSACAQTTGGTAGPDVGLIAAVDRWLLARTSLNKIPPAPTPEPTFADLAAQVAELRARLDAHRHAPDGTAYWHNPPVTGQAKVDLSAPTFTTSRKPEPAEAVMTDDEIVAHLLATRIDRRLEDMFRDAIRLTRASIRAQLAANEAGAVEVLRALFMSSPLEDAALAALKAHGEGV